MALLRVLLPMEKQKRNDLIPILQEWRALLCDALAAKSGMPAASAEAAAICQSRTSTQLLRTAQNMQTAMDKLNVNVGVGSVIGWLVTQLH